MRRVPVTVVVSILTLVSLTGCAEKTCTKGWFGSNCQYQCHCTNDTDCGKDDGSCSSGCHKDWFGPACQYARMGFSTTEGSDLDWLLDQDDTTCNSRRRENVQVTLDTPIPLSWVRIVVNSSNYLGQIQLHYQPSNSSSSHTCGKHENATVDGRTLDVKCPTTRIIRHVILSGEGVDGLCSLYISGGRNVALKQETNQSSHYTSEGAPDSYRAEYAVDGRTGEGGNVSVLQHTCTHTRSTEGPGWWTVTFSQPVDITWFLIYNRPGYYGRLKKFTLTAESETSSDLPYNYTDPGEDGQATYTVVPSPRINFRVSQVRFDKESGGNPIMTLCEVYVYGETPCSTGQFGLGCERQCNCADQTESCFVHSGGCPSGCAPGFTGEDCTECRTGRHGSECNETCSETCAGDNNPCHKIDGACSLGCDPGFNGTFCQSECDAGTYGDGCSSRCTTNCAGPKNACHHVTGDCDGCDPGYQGVTCDQDCNPGYYGGGCGETCSEHCAGDQDFCDHVNGTCDLGCDPGYQGYYCIQECSATTWGPNCNLTCNNTCPDSNCDHVTGDCICPSGNEGVKCDQSVVTVKPTNEASEGGGAGIGSIIPIVVGAAGAVGLILLIVAAVFLWRRRRQSKAVVELTEENGARSMSSGNQMATFSEDTAPVADTAGHTSHVRKRSRLAARAVLTKTSEDFEEVSEEDSGVELTGIVNPLAGNTAVPVETLKTYILRHAADSHFKEGFSSVPMATSSPQTIGLLPENVKKNRYKNIIPYDANRVLLQINQDKNQTDYINASYVKGYSSGEIFIASQGPKDLILNDFVRMLWEQRVDRVVMLTNLVELGKKKCAIYWPSDGEEEFGEIKVRLLTTHVFAEYTIRRLRLTKTGEPARDVTQFHFTAWPDKSVPESPWGLADLHQRVMSVPGSGPILVHCSAGVGRTGTFIALCNLLQEAEVTGKMDFLSTLWKLRQDRMHTIQTVAQYIFLHKVALVGHVIAGTTIQVKDIDARLAILEKGKGDSMSASSYNQEFEAMIGAGDATSTKPAGSPQQQEEKVYQNTSGVADKTKNRLSNILPNQTFRPVLTAEAHHEDTYINAVLVPSLTKDSQDILTQVPMPSTVTDFWRLITQYNVGLVVAFDTNSGQGDETIGEFLPKSETEPFENERYLVETKPPTDSTLATEFSLTCHQKVVPGMDTPVPRLQKTLTFLQCKGTVLNPLSVLDLQQNIKSHRPGGESRVVFMCRNGADQCGLMCVQSILLDRLETDQCLTVPLVVGTIKAIRPQVIPTVAQYQCLYRVLQLAIQSQNVYGNVGETSKLI